MQLCPHITLPLPICLTTSPLLPCSKVACGILIGVQEGGGVVSGSTAAIGLNSGLLATKLLYAVYLTAIRPQVSGCMHAQACDSKVHGHVTAVPHLRLIIGTQ